MTSEPLDPTGSALDAAERTDREMREQVNTIARARAQAASEAARLHALATRPGVDAQLAALADRYEQQTVTLDAELGVLHDLLERQRVTIERLRAEGAGA